MKRFSLWASMALLIGLLTVISCQHEDEKSDGPVFVTVKVRLNSRNESMGPSFVLSSGVVSAFVSAVPDSFYPFTPSTDLGAGFDAQLFNLSDGTVLLTVPLDTPMRLAKVTYSADLSLEAMLSGATQPSFLGASDAFTVTAGTTSMTVEVVMETISGSSPIIGGTNQSTPLSLAGNSTYFAGDNGTAGAAAGTGTIDAVIPYPYGLTTDGTYLYATDSAQSVIYRINISTSVVEIIAGQDMVTGSDDNSVGTSATFTAPAGITYLSEPSGEVLYVTDYSNNNIRRVKLSGTFEVSTVAGFAGPGSYVDDPTGTDARFETPYGIVADRSGDFLYVADQDNHAIRKISTTFPNAVTNLAGADDGVSLGNVNDTGTDARFENPTDVMIVDDFLYVTDMNNGSIRKVDITTREVTDFATGFSIPRGLSTDGTNLYVSSTGAWQIYIVPLATGTPTVLSGWGSPGCTEGPSATAAFTTLKGLVSDGNALYGADNGCAAIFRID